MGRQDETVAQDGEDEAGQQAHVEPRDRQKMREIRLPKVLGHVAGDPGAVPGDDCRRNPADPFGHSFLQPPCQLRTQPVQPKGRAVLPGAQHEGRCARVAHSAQLIEIRVAGEVEATRFDRAAGW